MTPRRNRYDAVVVGGGFFGSYFAVHLAAGGASVLLLERENRLFRRASLVNQARIHRGYHYPRSVLTALRSAINFHRFVDDFRGAVETAIPAYYAIARQNSNVTAVQYRRFCEAVGIPLRPAPAAIERLFQRETIEAVFAVEEYLFNGESLREEMERRLESAGVEVMLSAEVRSVKGESDGASVRFEGDEGGIVAAGRAFVCCYSRTNVMMRRGGVTPPALKHEVTEMALVSPPEPLAGVAITVMCGPFFSLVPLPGRGMHTLSHVRYTPHFTWIDADQQHDPDAILSRIERRSRYPEMMLDASRYVPAIREARYGGSLWEVKTVLPQSETNDSRPILYVEPRESPDVVYVMGAKIDNVYDVCELYDSARTTAGRR